MPAKSISTVDNRTQKSDSQSESEEELFFHSVDTETGVNGLHHYQEMEDRHGRTRKSTL